MAKGNNSLHYRCKLMPSKLSIHLIIFLNLSIIYNNWSKNYTQTGAAPVEKNKWSQTNRNYGKDPMQSLIMQDSQDPDEDIEDIDIKATLLEVELREQRKRESREENANLSPSHEPIFKSYRW